MDHNQPPEPADPGTGIQELLDLLGSDRAEAADRLVALFLERYATLCRWLLRSSPAVARFEQTSDLLHESALRLWRALSNPSCTPATMQQFDSLCRQHIKWQLGDLVRRHKGPHGLATHYATPAPQFGAERTAGDPLDRFGVSTQDSSLIDWTTLHEQASALPPDERAVFEFCYYDELTQQEAADRLGKPLIWVKRRWRNALLHIQEALADSP